MLACESLQAQNRRGRGSSSSPLSRDALEGLLPGSETVTLQEPSVAGGLGYRAVKRTFDICASAVALVVLAIPMFVVSARIRHESPGPAFYSQDRVGLGGKTYKMYKFRSMTVDAESGGPRWSTTDDARVTPYGRKLRDTHFDEVPQFWNVLKGDMSLVGPRPERPMFCDAFERRIKGWHYRTLVKPGMSGLAQVVGGYSMLPRDKVLLDLEYIEHRSLCLDLKIMLRTFSALTGGRSADR